MIDVSSKNIVRQSAATGCPGDVVDKALIIADTLEVMFSYPQCSCFAVNGSSAKNLLYYNNRLYTGVSLEYAGNDEPNREKIASILYNMLCQNGVRLIKTMSEDKNTDAFVCGNTRVGVNNIKFSLTIDYGPRTAEPVIRRTVKVLGYEGDVPVNTFGMDRLNRDILDSLVARTSPVDVYDLFCCMTENSLKTREEMYGMCGQCAGRYSADTLAYAKARLAGLADRDFRYFLEPLLMKGTVFDWHEAVDRIAALL
ncbi:MAG: hypothetical protein LUD51_04825 [Clostridia bacterium]|nr:hypothetical protein [Clostridia bacterium]